jgi:hypothetical protein
MLYARINLQKTNYELYPYYQILTDKKDTYGLQAIYHDYCRYKRFKSVMPIFDEEFSDPNNDVIGYYHNDNLVAFSLLRRYNSKSVEAVQFAWDYANPELELGFASLRNECALYKSLGYKYLYLGGADEYKSKFDGFEILGPV